MSSLQWQILIFGLIAIFLKYMIGVAFVTYYRIKAQSVGDNTIVEATNDDCALAA